MPGCMGSKLSFRMGKASAAYGKLRERLWDNYHGSLRVKCQVYKAIVLSTLLYGAERWTVYRTQLKKLNSYIIRHLREIMKLTWKDKVSNHKN